MSTDILLENATNQQGGWRGNQHMDAQTGNNVIKEHPISDSSKTPTGVLLESAAV